VSTNVTFRFIIWKKEAPLQILACGRLALVQEKGKVACVEVRRTQGGRSQHQKGTRFHERNASDNRRNSYGSVQKNPQHSEFKASERAARKNAVDNGRWSRSLLRQQRGFARTKDPRSPGIRELLTKKSSPLKTVPKQREGKGSHGEKKPGGEKKTTY